MVAVAHDRCCGTCRYWKRLRPDMQLGRCCWPWRSQPLPAAVVVVDFDEMVPRAGSSCPCYKAR